MHRQDHSLRFRENPNPCMPPLTRGLLTRVMRGAVRPVMIIARDEIRSFKLRSERHDISLLKELWSF